MLGHIDPDEAAQAAIIAAETLTEPCRIQRSRRVRDTGGGFTTTWETFQTTTCAISRTIVLQESERQGVVTTIARFRAQFPSGTDLRARDRVDVADGTYEVLGTDRGITGPSLLNATLVRVGQA